MDTTALVLNELVKMFGPIGGAAAFGLGIVWRQWHVTMAKVEELHEKRITEALKTADDYSAFTTAMERLTEVVSDV